MLTCQGGSTSALIEVGAVALSLLLYRFAVSPVTKLVGQPQNRPQRNVTSIVLACVAAALSLMTPFVSPLGWSSSAGPLKPFMLIVTGVLSWLVVTLDFDLTIRLWPQATAKALIVVLWVAVLFSPWAIVGWLLLGVCAFPLWAHHEMMAVRTIKGFVAWLIGSAVLRAVLHGCDQAVVERSVRAAGVILVGSIILSHYFKPAVGKIRMGRRPWSWVAEEQVHHFAASARTFGHARWMPEDRYARIVASIRPFNVAIAAATLAIELMPLASFSARSVLIATLLLFGLFNIAVALAEGYVFWVSIIACWSFAACLWLSPAAELEGAFGLVPWLVSLALLAFAIIDAVWQPYPLAWWSTPWAAGVAREVQTADGSWWSLRHDFWSPHHDWWSKRGVDVITPGQRLSAVAGWTTSWEQRDAILATGGDPSLLDSAKEEHGFSMFDQTELEQQQTAATEILRQLNAGAPKHVLPRGLRWLAAPTGCALSWSDLPRYGESEPVCRMRLRLVERYFVDERSTYVTIRDEVFLEFPIP
jgi:hypothetical protein